MNRPNFLKSIVLICLVTTLLSCMSVGTKILPKNRRGFDDAMIVSEEQQLLLNLVRLQFEDRPFFINVDTITTSNTLTGDISADASLTSSPSRNFTVNSGSIDPDTGISTAGTTFSDNFSLSRFISLTPNVSYSDSPTISFSPLQGEAFMRHILKPIALEDIYLLLATEWSAERVFRITMEEIYDMPNDSKISDLVLPNKIPHNKRFIEFSRLVTYLQLKHMIYFSVSKIDHIELPEGMTREQFDQDENFR